MKLDEMSDMDLLVVAFQDAMDAHESGLIIGTMDDTAFSRAARRARRQDAARVLRTSVPAGDAA